MVKNPPAKQETWVRPLVWEDALKKEMAIPSSILAWEIPWTEDPDGLQSMRLQMSWTQLSNETAIFILYEYMHDIFLGFPGGSDGKESACSVGDLSSIPGLGRSPGKGNGYPLQYSCLENSMDR